MLKEEPQDPVYIDAIFTAPSLNHLQFFIVEMSDIPVCEDFEYFIGDRSKNKKKT